MKDILEHKRLQEIPDIIAKDVLPKEYYDFLDVFEKRLLEKPLARGRYDVSIQLKEGAVLPRI